MRLLLTKAWATSTPRLHFDFEACPSTSELLARNSLLEVRVESCCALSNCFCAPGVVCHGAHTWVPDDRCETGSWSSYCLTSDPPLPGPRIRPDFLGLLCWIRPLHFGFLVFLAFLAWQLSALAPETLAVMHGIKWGLAICFGIETALTWRYFFIGPIIFAWLSRNQAEVNGFYVHFNCVLDHFVRLEMQRNETAGLSYDSSIAVT